jgi:hypothetical protein
MSPLGQQWSGHSVLSPEVPDGRTQAAATLTLADSRSPDG